MVSHLLYMLRILGILILSISYLTFNLEGELIKTLEGQIADETKELYNKTLVSSLDSDECNNVKKLYKYRDLYFIYNYLYVKDGNMSLLRDINYVDVCDSSNNSSTYTEYYYVTLLVTYVFPVFYAYITLIAYSCCMS